MTAPEPAVAGMDTMDTRLCGALAFSGDCSSSTRCNTHSSACKTGAGFRRSKGGSCGVQQVTKVVKAQMVRGEGSGPCTGHQETAGREGEVGGFVLGLQAAAYDLYNTALHCTGARQ